MEQKPFVPMVTRCAGDIVSAWFIRSYDWYRRFLRLFAQE
jgi:hypothetical protein